MNQSEAAELLDALEKSMATGVLEVRYQDRTVKYRSMEEMEKARDMLLRKLGKNKRKRIYMNTSKGLK